MKWPHLMAILVSASCLAQGPLALVRLERESPCWQGVSLESQARLSREMPIGTFCNSYPLNSFDSDGRLNKGYDNFGVSPHFLHFGFESGFRV